MRVLPQAGDAMLDAHSGKHLLVVCHAGVIRMLLAQVLGMPAQNAYRIQVGSAAISRITVEARHGQGLATLMFHDGVLPERKAPFMTMQQALQEALSWGDANPTGSARAVASSRCG